MGETDFSKLDLSGFYPSALSKQQPPKLDLKPSQPKEMATLIPLAATIQSKLKALDIPTLIAGGVATDVLARQSLQNHAVRLHKDIDLLIARDHLHSVDEVMSKLGLTEAKQEAKRELEAWRQGNLRTFEGKDGVRVDVMGYYTTPRKDVRDFPLMSWGEIDMHRTPIEISLISVRVAYEDIELEVLAPDSLLSLKSAQDTRFDKDDTGERDKALLSRLSKK